MMNTVVCRAPGVLVLERQEIPVRGPGEVLLRVRRVGICGTDMHIFRGTQPYLAYPRVMGHELAGCHLKEGGCAVGGLFGFLFGFVLLPVLYYGFGCLVSAILRLAFRWGLPR